MLQVKSLVRTVGQRCKCDATGCNVHQIPLHCLKRGFRLRIELEKGAHMQLSDRSWQAHVAKVRG